jgi:N-acyl-D-aspartate/D-glutamate deacylase
MSGYPADRYRLRDRGKLGEGLPADVVVFNADIVADKSTFESPIQYPAGVPFVFVNGTLVINKGEPTADRPGQVLRRN